MTPDTPLVRRVSPSPNRNDRRGRPIDALILHYTGMASGDVARARLLDPAAEVSSHYLVWEDGEIEQLVAEADRAWHAGRSFWAGETDMNARTIGIEIVNGGHEFGCPPYPDAQIAGVIALCRDICQRHAIPPHRVLAHSDVAPARKQDPGEWFPWQRLAAAGVGVWPDPEHAPGGPLPPPGVARVAALQDALARYGYESAATGAFDTETQDVVTALFRHFVPAALTADAPPSHRIDLALKTLRCLEVLRL